jgi:anti-sigma regulatory factor (Ser/Thr protein kinase)
MRSAHVAIELKNDLSELTRLTEALEDCGGSDGLSPGAISKVNLALEEIVTNIISYGWEGNGEHRIKVDLRLKDRGLTARIEDDGRPFNPLLRVEPDVTLPLEARVVGGLGLLLVKRLMNHVSYSRLEDKNVLEISYQD